MDIVRSTIKVFASRITGSAIQFMGIVYFAQELGASSMGVFFLFTAILGMLTLVADFGLRGAVEKRVSEGTDRGEILSGAFVLKILPIILVSLGIFLFRPLINGYIGADVAVFLIVTMVLQEVGRLSLSVLKGELRVGEIAVLSVARQTTWVVVGGVLITYGFGVAGLLYGLLSGYSVMLIWGWYKVSVHPSVPSLNHVRSVLDYGQYNVISSIGNYFYSWMDVAVIGLFLTQAHVGAYEIAWRITVIPILFSQSIATTLFPKVSEWSATGKEDRISDLIRDLLTPSLALVIPAFFGSLLLSKDILAIVFGPEYVIAWVPLIILMFNRINEAANVILGRALEAINRPDLAARATIVGVVLNGGLNLVLTWTFGLPGAAIATVTASLVSGTAMHAFYLSTFVSIRVPIRELGWCVVSALGMTAVLLIVNPLVVVESVSDLILLVSIGAAVYGCFLLLLPSLRTKMFKHSRELVVGVMRSSLVV